MAHNQQGIAISIKAWLPTGTTIDEQFEALSLVKQAHASGDYSALLAAAQIEAVKAEQKNRRVEEPAPPFASGRSAPEPVQTDHAEDTEND